MTALPAPPLEAGALAAHLESLERELLTPAARHNPGRLRELLAPDFREFGASGRVFTLESILEDLAAESPATSLTLTAFRCDPLAPGCALVTYRSRRDSASGTDFANRSSLWVLRGEHWQLLFHQGTHTSHIP